MALKTFNSMAEVPEALREHYVERDGRAIPDVADAEDLYAAGLKKNQQRLLDEVKAARQKLAAYDGVDAEEYKKLKGAADEAERKAQQAAGNWEARENALKEAHAKERKALEEQHAKLRSTVERVLGENEVRRHLEPLAMPDGGVDVLLPHAMKHVKVVEENGEFKAVVMGANGIPRFRDAQGTPFSLEDLAKEMAESKQYAPLFRGTNTGGSGGKGSEQRKADVKVIPPDDNNAFIENLDGIIAGKVTVGS